MSYNAQSIVRERRPAKTHIIPEPAPLAIEKLKIGDYFSIYDCGYVDQYVYVGTRIERDYYGKPERKYFAVLVSVNEVNSTKPELCEFHKGTKVYLDGSWDVSIQNFSAWEKATVSESRTIH